MLHRALALGVSILLCGLCAADVRLTHVWQPVQAERPVRVKDLLELKDIGARFAGRRSLFLSPDGKWVAVPVSQMEVSSNRYLLGWKAVCVESGAVVDLGDGGDYRMHTTNGIENGNAAATFARWSPDGKWLAFLKLHAGQTQIWRSSADGKIHEQVSNSAGDVNAFEWTSNTSFVLRHGETYEQRNLDRKTELETGFLWDEDFYPLMGRRVSAAAGGAETFTAFNLTGNREERAATVREIEFFRALDVPYSPAVGRAAACTSDDWFWSECVDVAGRFICFREAPNRPRELVSIDGSTGGVTTLWNPNPRFASNSITRIEKLEWHDVYGNDTFGHLVYPAGFVQGRQYPLIIVQYRSRGFLRGGTGDEYPIHPLAAEQFFVLSVDRPDFKRTASSADRNERARYVNSQNREHLSKQSALERVLDDLEARGLIDPRRVGITGLSDGAETVRIGLIHSRRFAAAALSQVDGGAFSYYLISENHRRRFEQSVPGYREPDDSEESRVYWKHRSLGLNAPDLNVPILMHLSSSEMLMAAYSIVALKNAGCPIEAYVYPDAFHIKHQPRQLEASMERTIDWFNFWLRGVENGAESKRKRYQRWRTLREKVVQRQARP